MGKQSSARLSGDDYQHLFSWVECLKILDDSYEYRTIQLEADDAGFVDDIVLFPSDTKTYAVKYFQLKYHVDHKLEFSSDFLTMRIKGKMSMLEKLWSSYQKLNKKYSLELYLSTNWLWGKSDVLKQFVKDNFGLNDEFFGNSKKAIELRQVMADHLKVDSTSQDFVGLLRSLRFLVGYDASRLKESLQLVASRVGVQADDSAILKSVGIVREWIKQKKNKVIKSDVEQVIQKNRLKIQDAKIVVYLHTKEIQSFSDLPDQVLNFVDLFNGRNIQDNSYWNTIILNQIKTLKDLVNTTSSIRNIRLYGKSSLSVGAAFGFVFSDSSGYQIEVQQGGQFWNTTVTPKTIKLDIKKIVLNNDALDIGVALSISGNIEQSVMRHIEGSSSTLKELYSVKVLPNPSNTVIRSDREARYVCNSIRELIRNSKKTQVEATTHFFTACPLAMSVMLGHQFNACGHIQLYEYLDPGYTKSILL